ncbi:MAG TPA: NAD(P)-binding domain-containing protein, partial [Candidatus Binatia bacterium]|nr:NAD(P)-binding domain-containing protein [Candidatus Binatia bacterium]
MKEIGVIGLGNAGKPLALRLIDKGYRLRAFDLNTQVMDEVAQRGAAKVISSADAVAEVTLTVLPSSVEVKAAIFGAAGVLASLKQGRTLIDLSGTDPSFTRVLAEEAE